MVVGNPAVISFKLIIHSHNVWCAAVVEGFLAVSHKGFQGIINITLYLPSKALLCRYLAYQFRIKFFCPVNCISITQTCSWLFFVEPVPKESVPYRSRNFAVPSVPCAAFVNQPLNVVIAVSVPFSVEDICRYLYFRMLKLAFAYIKLVKLSFTAVICSSQALPFTDDFCPESNFFALIGRQFFKCSLWYRRFFLIFRCFLLLFRQKPGFCSFLLIPFRLQAFRKCRNRYHIARLFILWV